MTDWLGRMIQMVRLDNKWVGQGAGGRGQKGQGAKGARGMG